MRSAFPTLKTLATRSSRPVLALFFAVALASSVAGEAAASKYASIVVDANTGKTLHASSADAPRYPASLTKMMTLYMVFEALKSGQVTKNTKVPFSKHAASKPPTKLGVRAGGSITIETAIYALVTKSANDAAAAVAELLGGSEAKFARMMTDRARQLGMSSTTFRNASGLPDSSQRTTARDMARLGIALREHFPQYYDYFATRSYAYGKTRLTNHNRLLGRVTGVDGIKTGYIRASGFNLVSSVKTGGKSIVAVVMGGRTGASRDAHMIKLINEYLPKASTTRGGNLVASAARSALPKQNIPAPVFRPEPVVDVGAAVVTAYASAGARKLELADDPAPVDAQGSVDTSTIGSDPIEGWVIQVASMPSETQARRFLAETSRKLPTLLADAAAFTEVFDQQGTVYYRARFGGFPSKSAAWNACGALKKKKIACYAVQQ